MIKRLLLPLYCICFSVLYSSCGPPINGGKQVSNTPVVAAFDGVEIDAPLKASIDVTPGTQPGVVIAGPEDLTKYIKTKVENNTLQIYMDDDIHFGWDDDLKAHITVPALKMLSISGAGSTDVNGNVAGADFKLDISGVGKVNIAAVNIATLSADVSGAGKVTIKSGRIQSGGFDLSGTGYIDAYGAQCTEAKATVSGAGFINVNVNQKLAADISGIGSIRYKGHPEITSSTSGVGKLVNAN